jgi:nucleoside-diphosphate-sugar epimerase
MPVELAGALQSLPGSCFVNADTSLPPAVDLYALSKAQATQWLRALAGMGRLRVLNVRLESVIGPGDDGTKFVPQLVRALLRNEASFPMTPGDQARDFIYVEDAAEALGLLAEHAASGDGGVWQEAGVGTGRPTSIRDLAGLAARLTGSTTRIQPGALPARPNELMSARADTRLLHALGWGGSRDLESSLRETIRGERERS